MAPPCPHLLQCHCGSHYTLCSSSHSEAHQLQQLYSITGPTLHPVLSTHFLPAPLQLIAEEVVQAQDGVLQEGLASLLLDLLGDVI